MLFVQIAEHKWNSSDDAPALQDNSSDPSSESESDSKDSSELHSEESSKSEGSTNDCDEGVNVHKGEAVQLSQLLNGNSSKREVTALMMMSYFLI